MTTETPAALLRRAAARLREEAGAATKGPWEDRVDDLTDDVGVWHDQEHVQHVAATGIDAQARVDATYIATMHPGVGLALAGHLDDTATGIERDGVTARLTPAEMSATAIARRVLGEEA